VIHCHRRNNERLHAPRPDGLIEPAFGGEPEFEADRADHAALAYVRFAVSHARVGVHRQAGALEHLVEVLPVQGFQCPRLRRMNNQGVQFDPELVEVG
jgi:hypothetical protein